MEFAVLHLGPRRAFLRGMQRSGEKRKPDDASSVLLPERRSDGEGTVQTREPELEPHWIALIDRATD
jgi:hypothetical protein